MIFRRKAILFIHGFVGGTYDFGDLPNILESNKKFDVYTFTLPGHDLTIVKGRKYLDWINEAERQMQFLLNCGYKDIYVVGHSMGGVIASYIAGVYPQVKKLVLAAPAFGFFSFKNGSLDIKGFNDTIKNLGTTLGENSREVVVSRIIKTPINTMLEFTKLVNEYHDSVKKVTCDTLIIHGLRDDVVPEDAIKYVHDNIASKTNILYNIKDVNHNCFREKRSILVYDIIINFLKKKQIEGKDTINL